MSLEVHPDSLVTMRSRDRAGTQWWAYRNEALDATLAGHLVFLQCGEGCSHPEPPEQAPDGSYGAGWKYRLLGRVNLETGLVEEVKP